MGLFNGNWDQGQGILPSGSADMTYPEYTQVPAAAAASGYSPQSQYAPPPMQNYSPAAPQMTAQPMGFMDRINGALSNPLTQFGLGLASGRTPQEGFGNALQSVQFRQKLEHEKMTADIKEYQYAVSTGSVPPGTSFTDFQQLKGSVNSKLGMQGIPLTDEQGNIAYGQLGNRPGGGMQLAKPPEGYQVANKLLKQENATHTWLADPNTGQIAPGTYQSKNVEEGARQKEVGKEGGAAQINLPVVENTVNRAVNDINKVMTHPGQSMASGPILGRLPGIAGKQLDYVERVDQLKAEAFLSSYVNALKGGGQISNIEGEKGTVARARLNRAKNTEDFNSALQDLKGLMQQDLVAARRKAFGSQGSESAAPAVPSESGWTDLGGGYRMKEK